MKMEGLAIEEGTDSGRPGCTFAFGRCRWGPDRRSTYLLLVCTLPALLIAFLAGQMWSQQCVCICDPATLLEQATSRRNLTSEQSFCKPSLVAPTGRNSSRVEVVTSADSKAMMRFKGYLAYDHMSSTRYKVEFINLKLTSLAIDGARLYLDLGCAQAAFDLVPTYIAPTYSSNYTFRRSSMYNSVSLSQIIVDLARPHMGVKTCFITYPSITYKMGAHYACSSKKSYSCYGVLKTQMSLVATLVIEDIEFEVDSKQIDDSEEFSANKEFCAA